MFIVFFYLSFKKHCVCLGYLKKKLILISYLKQMTGLLVIVLVTKDPNGTHLTCRNVMAFFSRTSVLLTSSESNRSITNPPVYLSSVFFSCAVL